MNRAATRLSDQPVTGMTMGSLPGPCAVRRADGSLVVESDLPCTRALRGEHAIHGERTEATRADGSSLRIVVEPTPIIVGGQVVAALPVWHDVDAYLQGLADGRIPGNADGTARD